MRVNTLQRHSIRILGVLTLVCSTTLALGSGLDNADASDNLTREVSQLVERAVSFLSASQAEDGSFSSHTGTGVTSVVTAGLLQNGRTANDPLVRKALEYLQENIQPDGGIYQSGSRYRNYETCLAMLCFNEANTTGQYNELLSRAEAFVKDLQWDEGEGHDQSSLSYGGAGYGSHSRPDLSNTSFLIDSLNSLGRDENDPAIQKALDFVSRCQNLETEHNDTKFASMNPDGGFYYTVAAGGTSQAGTTSEGGLRSYGSMTYAGLKSMIYAGVEPDDPRVKAAFEWARNHYTLEENPGMGNSGLYYYYHTFAKALHAMDKEEVVDIDGNSHRWQQELVAELADRQQENGSWVNTNERWLEGDPNLVTGYVLMALAYCQD